MAFDFRPHVPDDNINDFIMFGAIVESIKSGFKIEESDDVNRLIAFDDKHKITELVNAVIEADVEIGSETIKLDYKIDKFAEELFKKTITPEFHLKRGYLDATLESRIKAYNQYEQQLFPGISEIPQCHGGERHIVPINDKECIYVIPYDDFVKDETVYFDSDRKFERIILFVDEATPRCTHKVGENILPNPETFIFKGIYSLDLHNALKLESKQINVPYVPKKNS